MIREAAIQKPQVSPYWLLRASLIYVAATLIVHVIGPWEFVGEKIWPVVVFMVAAMTSFAFGYRSVVKRFRGMVHRDDTACERNFRRYRLLSRIGLAVQATLLIAAVASDVMNGRISLGVMPDPGQIYVDALEAARYGVEISLVGQLQVVLSPLILLSNVYLLLNFSRISLAWRMALVGTLILQVAHGALTKGAQKGFFDLVILLAAIGFIRAFFNRELFARYLKAVAALLALVVSIFVFFQLSRFSTYNVQYYAGTDEMVLDPDSVIFRVFGDSIGLGLTLFGVYLTHGYYGLSLCLQLPFQWTYGLGSSFALASYAEQYLGISGIHEAAYPYRMEEAFGWPATRFWHTIFPWLASDLTFPGTIVAMFLIGKMLARSMVDALVKESPLGLCIFYFLLVLVLYIPANNQLLQTREMAVSFLVLAAFWVGSKLSISAPTRGR